MTTSSIPVNSLQLESLPVNGDGIAFSQIEKADPGATSAHLVSSIEMLQTESALAREQAQYLRQVSEMTPEELAQSLQQLQAAQAQLTFERGRNLALTEAAASNQLQWQLLSVGLALVFVILLLWSFMRRRRASAQNVWHANAVHSGLQAERRSHLATPSDDVENEYAHGSATEARVSEIWADSQDWLVDEKVVPHEPVFQPISLPPSALNPFDGLDEASASSIEKETEAHEERQPQDAHKTTGHRKESWTVWAHDAQPQPGQPLVDYLRSLRRMLLLLLDAGRLLDARSLLYAHIRLVKTTSPWAYMAYFALQTTETPQVQEVRESFTQQFGREAPGPSEFKQNSFMQRGLADYQYSLAQLSQTWPTERAVLLLENWLSPGKRRTFTLQAYDDLFVLYDVIDQLHGLESGANATFGDILKRTE